MAAGLLSATTLRVRHIGTTIDFCPVCRCQRTFRFAEARTHRYFLMLDQGPIAQPHHELSCTSCSVILQRDVAERPVTMTTARGGVKDPEVLPLVVQRIHDWEDMEQRRKAGKLRQGEREEMIRTAMLSFSKLYDEQLMERVHPSVLMAMALASAGLALGGYWVWRTLESHWVIVGVLVAIIAMMLLMLAWVRSRCPRTRVRRWVAAALAPLDPTEAEIAAIKREMLTRRLKSGECIKPARMRRAIDKQRLRMGLARPA